MDQIGLEYSVVQSQTVLLYKWTNSAYRFYNWKCLILSYGGINSHVTANENIEPMQYLWISSPNRNDWAIVAGQVKRTTISIELSSCGPLAHSWDFFWLSRGYYWQQVCRPPHQSPVRLSWLIHVHESWDCKRSNMDTAIKGIQCQRHYFMWKPSMVVNDNFSSKYCLHTYLVVVIIIIME